MDTEGSAAETQTITVERNLLPKPPTYPEIPSSRNDVCSDDYLRRMGLEDITPNAAGRHEMIDLTASYNANLNDIFRNRYESPRPPYTTLQIPVQGIGEWCHPKTTAEIDDSGLRACATPLQGSDKLGVYDTGKGLSFLIPRQGRNIVFSSLWDNYPDEVSVPISTKSHSYNAAYLMMAGTTNNMQSRIDNALVMAEYEDGSCDTLRLENPINWPTVNEEFVFDGKAFWSAPVMPLRFRLDNGRVGRQINARELLSVIPSKHDGKEKKIGDNNRYAIDKGAGVILKMPLDSARKIRAIRVKTLSNDIVVGLMAVTLEKL